MPTASTRRASTLWEVGNESYACYETNQHLAGSPTYVRGYSPNGPVCPPTSVMADSFAVNAVPYLNAMKQADPTAQIGVPWAFDQAETVGAGIHDSTAWNDTVLPAVKSDISFVDAHWYPFDTVNGLSDQQILATVNAIPAAAADIRSTLQRLDPTAYFVVGETNISSVQSPLDFQPVSALFAAATNLEWLAQGAQTVDWWDLSNFGSPTTGDYGLLSSGAPETTPAGTPMAPYYGEQLASALTASGSHLEAINTGSPNLFEFESTLKKQQRVLFVNTDPNAPATIGNGWFTKGQKINLSTYSAATSGSATAHRPCHRHLGVASVTAGHVHRGGVGPRPVLRAPATATGREPNVRAVTVPSTIRKWAANWGFGQVTHSRPTAEGARPRPSTPGRRPPSRMSESPEEPLPGLGGPLPGDRDPRRRPRANRPDTGTGTTSPTTSGNAPPSDPLPGLGRPAPGPRRPRPGRAPTRRPRRTRRPAPHDEPVVVPPPVLEVAAARRGAGHRPRGAAERTAPRSFPRHPPASAPTWAASSRTWTKRDGVGSVGPGAPLVVVVVAALLAGAGYFIVKSRNSANVAYSPPLEFGIYPGGPVGTVNFTDSSRGRKPGRAAGGPQGPSCHRLRRRGPALRRPLYESFTGQPAVDAWTGTGANATTDSQITTYSENGFLIDLVVRYEPVTYARTADRRGLSHVRPAARAALRPQPRCAVHPDRQRGQPDPGPAVVRRGLRRGRAGVGLRGRGRRPGGGPRQLSHPGGLQLGLRHRTRASARRCGRSSSPRGSPFGSL